MLRRQASDLTFRKNTTRMISDVYPLFSFSTHVAGTTCGNQFGVSRNCQLCSVKVMNANGGGTISDIIAGINHVVATCSAVGSLCVANISLGGVGYNEIFNAAVSSAVSKGVVMVVAAGNNNDDACSYSPASTALAITVGSTTMNDQKSSFSNWGSCIDVYAPGSDITSSWKSSPAATSTISGTSMATPRKSSHPRYLINYFHQCLSTHLGTK